MMAEIKLKLECPMIPNFIRIAGSLPGAPDASMPLADIPEETIIALGNEWRTAFFEKARKARHSFRPGKMKEEQ